MINKFSLKDIEKAIDTLRKKYNPEEIIVESTMDNRLVLRTTTIDGDSVTITIYLASTSKMPDITLTQRL